jgi:hypothetical protein
MRANQDFQRVFSGQSPKPPYFNTLLLCCEVIYFLILSQYTKGIVAYTAAQFTKWSLNVLSLGA